MASEETFWQNLVAGKSAIDYITAFDASPHSCQVAAEVKDFYPSDFMSARRAKVMSRFSNWPWRLLVLPWRIPGYRSPCQRTLSAAGPRCLASRLPWMASSRFRCACEIKPWTALEYPPHAAASYLAIEFGINGPALTISSNCCTAGVDAINAAARQIASGQVETAVASSSDAPIFPIIFDAFCSLGALTKPNDDPTRASRPYDLLNSCL